MGNLWKLNPAEGYAEGPQRTFRSLRGVEVTVAAYWSDEDGVSVALETGDELMPADVAAAVAVALAELAALPAPESVKG